MNEDIIYPSMVIRSQAEAIELLEKENKDLKDKVEKFVKWLNYKAEALDTFDIPKRKETGAFWFTTRGEIDGLLEMLKDDELEGKSE